MTCEGATVGGFSDFSLSGVFCDVGGEEGVGFRFRGDFEGFEQFVGGESGVVFAVDAGEGAKGLGFGGGASVAGIKLRGSTELRAGVVEVVVASEQEAEREMGFKGVGIGADGTAVKGGGVFEAVEVVGDVASVKEGAGICRVCGEPGVKLGGGGFPVGFDDACFGGGDLVREGARRGGNLSVWGLSGGRLCGSGG
jgi:hypothetical protein